jgi:hypothetical protein
MMLLSVLPCTGSLGRRSCGFIRVRVVLELFLTTRADHSHVVACGPSEARLSRGRRYVYRLWRGSMPVETVTLVIEVHGVVDQRIVHVGRERVAGILADDFQFDVCRLPAKELATETMENIETATKYVVVPVLNVVCHVPEET